MSLSDRGLRRMRGFFLSSVALALGCFGCFGCSGASQHADLDQGPALPPGFQPGPPLEAPPPPDPAAEGLAYLETLQPKLQSRWAGFLEDCRLRLPPSHALNNMTLAVTLELVLDDKGALAELRVAASSGSQELDDVAAEITRDAVPFTPPPPPLASDDDRFHILWRFARDRRQAGSAGAKLVRALWEADRAVPKFLDRGDLAEAARRLHTAAAVQPAEGGGRSDNLIALGDRVAAAAILVSLGQDDLATQKAGVLAAADARLAAASAILRELAVDAVDLELRRAAIEALGRIGNSEAVGLLAAIVGGEHGADTEQRGAAARALHALGASDEAWQAISPHFAAPDRRSATLAVLAQFPAPAAERELSVILFGAGPRAERVAAAAALGAIVPTDGEAGKQAARSLVKGLKLGDAALRAACAQALGAAARAGYASRSIYWPVVALIVKDRDERVRAAAILASAALGRDKFASEVYRLRKETGAALQLALAEALAHVPGEAALALLVTLSGSEDVAVTRAAHLSLASRDEPAARELLASRLGHEDPAIRALAIAVSEDQTALDGLVAGGTPASLQAAALARLAVLRGRMGVLAATAQLWSNANVADRATLAGAWLRGGGGPPLR
jgi:hypothetical protein